MSNQPIKTPKDSLMELANQNPAEMIVVVNINGRLTCMFQYGNVGSALGMQRFLNRTVDNHIDKVQGIEKADV